MGFNSLRMSQLTNITEGNKIHMFEPQHDVFTILKFNTRNIPRVLYNFGLSNDYKIMNFEVENIANMGATRLNNIDNEKKNNSVNVLVTKLDNIKLENRISIIKLDVEGGEYEVLLGGKELINRDKPTILIELWPDKYETSNNLLISYGYKQIWNNADDYLYIHESKINK